MPKGKSSNKSKAKKGFRATVDKEQPGVAAWAAWFTPTPSPSQSPPLMNPVIDEHMPSTEVLETQNPDISNEITQDGINHDIEKRKRQRGANKVIPTLTNPSDRIFISTLHDEKFEDHRIARTIMKSIQLNFSDAWPTWKKMPNDIKENMWAKFQEKFVWPIEKAKVVRKIWDTTCKERFKGMMEEERSRAMKHFNVTDIAKCKGYNEGWIRVDIWDRLVDNVWNTKAWKNQSQKGKQNRNTEKNGSITKHTGGSIPFILHAERMAKDLNRRATYGEVFNRTHKREKGRGDFVDNKSKSVSESYTSSMSQKYGSDESCHPEFDPQAWCDAIGGIETTRTHVYGFGTTPRAKNLFSPSVSVGEASYSACSPRTKYPPSSTEVDQLREEVTVVKGKLQNLEQSQQSLVEATDEIKAYLFQITKMLDSATMFPNASIGFSQATCNEKNQAEESTDSNDED